MNDPIEPTKESLTITDNRTGQVYELPIVDGSIRASDLRQIKLDEDDFGVLSYDPAFMNTASCRSAVTFIDGDAGILRYRGYPIEELAEGATFLEVAYLLTYGELPTAEELEDWTYQVTHHTFIHESIKKFIDGFHHDAHPMGILVSTRGGALHVLSGREGHHGPAVRHLQRVRLIAKMPTLAAFAHRHAQGLTTPIPTTTSATRGTSST